MKRNTLCLSITAGLCFALNVHAQPPASSGDATSDTAGIKVAIDPATGRIRDLTPEESAALSRESAQARASADIAPYRNAPADNFAAAQTVRKSANGSVSVRVPRSALARIHAHTGADGTLIVSEDGHADAAARPEAVE